MFYKNNHKTYLLFWKKIEKKTSEFENTKKRISLKLGQNSLNWIEVFDHKLQIVAKK